MKQRLRLSKLSEVSLVDSGDNPGATVSIHKRAADPTEKPSVAKRILDAVSAALGWTPEQYEKAVARMAPEEPTGDNLPDADPGSEPDGDEDDKPGKPGKGKGKKQQPTSKHEDPMPETKPVAETETVTKAEMDALRKRAEDAEKEQSELRKAFDAEVEKRELSEYVRKAEALRAIPGEPEAVAKMLLAVDKTLPADVAKQVRESFAALNRLAVEGGLLDSVGKSGSTEAPSGSAATEFMRLVTERVSKNKESMADAMRAVSKENPALYNNYLNERA